MGGTLLQENSIFMVATEIRSPEARTEYLKQVCGDNDAILNRITALLRIHDEEAGILEQPSVDAFGQPLAEQIGTYIGPYKLVEEIGKGGMGTVYRAIQKKPVHREVALKVVKAGMNTKDVVARFELERQTLALMDHTNIAHVLDVGATNHGRPFFIMELVDGVPITQYCEQNDLSIRERLQLFVQVCQAVQHAHQKGVIHRDLKPANVLVMLQDGKPTPKVIDFGIAKAKGPVITGETTFTDCGEMIGTPLYMSPEQAEVTTSDVDTRSDVYSLGVILYELLTSLTPVDKKDLEKANLDEIRRMIREDKTQRPSARVNTSAAEGARISPARRRLSLCRELDWIVMKALEKDRARRYETASEFAADVQRYLKNEAVEACPPSVGYRLSKCAQRHKGMVITVAAVAFALFLGAGTATWQAFEAISAKRFANEQHELAELRADQLLSSLGWNDLLLAEYLRRSPEYQEEAEAFHRQAVDTFVELSAKYPTEPIYQFRAALCMASLGDFLRFTDRIDEAESLLRESTERYERVSDEYPDFAPAMNGDVKERFEYNRADDFCDFAPYVRLQLGAIQSLTQLLETSRRFEEADHWQAHARELYPTSLLAESPLTDPEKCFRSSRIQEVEVYIECAPESLSCRWELANLFAEDGQFDKAVAEYSQAIQLDPENGDLYQKRGDAYQAMGETEKAEADHEEAKRRIYAL